MTARRQFLRLAGGGAVFAATAPLAACSSALPPEAMAAWAGPGAGETDPRRWALAHAILAPHSHNLQSWLVDLAQPGEITLFCDRERLLPETDPYSRQMMMSQGTFLELLAIAAAERGHRAEVTLFPQGAFGPDKIDGRPTARIRLVPDATVRRDPLFAQVFRRRTNRSAYDAMRAPDPAALQAIAAAMGPYPEVRAGFTDARDAAALQRHRALAREAWRIELTTPRTILESYRWLRVGPAEIAKHRDGISLNAPMVRALTALGLFDRSKAPAPDDSATTGQIKDFNAKIDGTPAFFWMATEGNARTTQVNAGRAYVRAQLAATAHGLAMHPLQQALQEYPEQARTYADIHALLRAPRPTHTVQMWTRLGYAPDVEPAPRRGLAAHLLAA
ncbi:MAG: twin-arginine translocation pathway signal protein [Pseudomonadota bacterium]